VKKRAAGATLREMGAMLTQARYVSLDLLTSHHHGPSGTVVLLHGLYASAGVWRPLRAHLEQQLQVGTHTLSYAPGPGIVELAGRVAELISTLASPSPIHLVGHSMGGLVMRYFASLTSCDSRVVQTISLAAPFMGSHRSGLVPGQAGRDIDPSSPLLVRLRENSAVNQAVPHLTLVAEEDEMILPGAYPHFGTHELIPRVGHNGMLFDQSVMDRVALQIARHPTAQRPT
jgi:triacylglycerol lipase